MEEVAKSILSVAATLSNFGGLGVAGWIAAAVFALVAAVGGFFLSRWAKQRAIDEANQETDKGRAEASAGTAQEGRQVEQDSGAAADEIDRLSGKPRRP